MEVAKKQFGLVGRDIGHSFSKAYFTEKFIDLHLKNCTYSNFSLDHISQFPEIIKNNPELSGLNVTIPYKESIIPFLDELSGKAKDIAAVNTIKFCKNGKLKGYNTDCYGFRKSLEPILKQHHKKALILGTGGASKAVAYTLDKLGLGFTYVSRREAEKTLTYDRLHEETFSSHQIIINCTPVGTWPYIDVCPDIPYEYLTDKHIAYDLIYNPSETLFLKKAHQHGAITKNGQEMLELQAEKSWEIWNR